MRLKNLMSVRTFLKLAVPRQAITSVPLGTHPSAHCNQRFPFIRFPGFFTIGRELIMHRMHLYSS